MLREQEILLRYDSQVGDDMDMRMHLTLTTLKYFV